MELTIEIKLHDEKYRVVVFKQAHLTKSVCDDELFKEIHKMVFEKIYPED